MHLGKRLRGVENLGGAAAAGLNDGRVVREVLPILRLRPGALAAEALHALRHIGLKAHAWLLAVVADVDARFQLPAHHLIDRRFDLPLQVRLVDGLAAFLPDQQVGQRPGPRQTADVGCQNMLFAGLHGSLWLSG